MDNSSVGCTVTPLNLLTIVFIVLKLTDVIAWSWWWVLSPTWIPLAVALPFLAVAAIIFVLAWYQP